MPPEGRTGAKKSSLQRGILISADPHTRILFCAKKRVPDGRNAGNRSQRAGVPYIRSLVYLTQNHVVSVCKAGNGSDPADNHVQVMGHDCVQIINGK